MNEYPIRKKLLSSQNVVDRAALREAGGYTIHAASRHQRSTFRILGLVVLLLVSLFALLPVLTFLFAVRGK